MIGWFKPNPDKLETVPVYKDGSDDEEHDMLAA
jgi:hypothetical protein